MEDILNLGTEEVFEVSACYIEKFETAFVYIYRNPIQSNIQNLFEKLNILLEKLLAKKVNSIVVGDFNFDFNSNDKNSVELSHLIISFGLNIMLKDEITRPVAWFD